MATAKTKDAVKEIPDGKEEIFIPRGEPNGDPNLFVSVNFVNYLLPRGKKSVVPAAVAKEIRRSWACAERRAALEDELKSK